MFLDQGILFSNEESYSRWGDLFTLFPGEGQMSRILLSLNREKRVQLYIKSFKKKNGAILGHIWGQKGSHQLALLRGLCDAAI